MERTLHAFTHDLATVAEVCTEVGTEGIQHSDLTRFAAKEHPIAAEVAPGLQIPGRQLVRPGDGEPAVGNRKREAIVAHRRGALLMDGNGWTAHSRARRNRAAARSRGI